MSAEQISILFTLFRIVFFAVLDDSVSAGLPLKGHGTDAFESEVIPGLRRAAENISNRVKFSILLFPLAIPKN
jgi:hypothetical protein